MFLFLRLFVALFLILFAQPLLSQDEADNPYEGKQEDPDMEALKKWIRQKRMVTVKEIGGDLALSGEARVEMQATSEKKNGVTQRGHGGATSRPAVAFDCEVNLMLDYRSPRTWASIKIEYDNDMGTVSGTTNHLALERAYWGGRIVDGETVSVDFEMGRRNLTNIFDSKIEFSSIFDGMLLKFSKASDAVGNFYLNSGAFLVNDYVYHFGYVSEMGLLNIGNTGFFTKYSFIDWKKHYVDPLKNLSFSFLISQLMFGYQKEIPSWGKLVKFYLAGLLNHDAKKIALTNYTKANYGWYIGFSVGQVRKTGDWALDVNYQEVAAQAVPDFDNGGIGRGNAANIGFYSTGKYGTGDATTNQTCVGKGNFKGLQAEVLYAITGNLTLLNNIQMSNNLNNNIGPKMRYFQYEIEFIYAF